MISAQYTPLTTTGGGEYITTEEDQKVDGEYIRYSELIKILKQTNLKLRRNMDKPTKYFAYYNKVEIGTYESLTGAKEAIANHSSFTKSKFTKKGTARSSNPNKTDSFRIGDNNGDCWYIY